MTTPDKPPAIQVDLQLATEDEDVPSCDDITQWARLTLAHARSAQSACEMTVRIVDLEEISYLNQQYRGKTGPTNVLSFPFEAPVPMEPVLLGDIVICAPVVKTEALEQQKQLTAHWAHMLTHGLLHLLGFDHESDEEASIMESMETQILLQQGFPNPYHHVYY